MDEARIASPAVALPEDLSACHAVIDELNAALLRKQHTIETLEHRLQQMLRARFGPRADRLDSNQLALFAADLIAEAQPSEPPAAKTNDAAPSKGQGHGRKRLPADLPRERIVHDLPEDQQACPDCGAQHQPDQAGNDHVGAFRQGAHTTADFDSDRSVRRAKVGQRRLDRSGQ